MAAVLLLAGGPLHRPIVSSLCLAAAITLAGLVVAQLYAFHNRRDHIGACATDDPRLAQLELRIEEPPRVLTNPFEQPRAMRAKQVLPARVQPVRTWDGWEEATGDVLVQVAQPHPRLAAGQTVRAIGQLHRPAQVMNAGEFGWGK